jgi:hypothetical protein
VPSLHLRDQRLDQLHLRPSFQSKWTQPASPSIDGSLLTKRGLLNFAHQLETRLRACWTSHDS